MNAAPRPRLAWRPDDTWQGTREQRRHLPDGLFYPGEDEGHGSMAAILARRLRARQRLARRPRGLGRPAEGDPMTERGGYADEVRALLGQADRLPTSAARLALLEEAARVADTHRDVPLGIEARRPLMGVARSLLRGDVLAAAFAWSLAQYDRDPRPFAGRNLLYEYHWVTGQMANLPDTARATLGELLEDFGRRLDSAGCSRRLFHLTRQEIAPDLGDRALAREAAGARRRCPRDALGLDPAFELRVDVETELFAGDDGGILRLAVPFLTGRYANHPLAANLCAYLLLPLLRACRGPEAAALFPRCLRAYRPDQCYYWSFGELLKYTALTGDLGRAARMYGECQRAINEHTDSLTRLHFALDAVVVLGRLAAEGRQEVALRLPDGVPVPHTAGHYKVAGLRDWLGREAADLAARFDARNGNGYFTEQLAERAELGLRGIDRDTGRSPD
jgi:hypothetical protein